jgi:carbon storage regulator
MLLLTRRLGEEIVIGDDIRVTVLAIHRKHIRLGITAPSETLIRRAELCHPVVGCKQANSSREAWLGRRPSPTGPQEVGR